MCHLKFTTLPACVCVFRCHIVSGTGGQ